MNSEVYRFYAATGARARCPACLRAVPFKGGAVRTRKLQYRPPGRTTETQCFLHHCDCGLAVAVHPTDEGLHVSFRCQRCECYGPALTTTGWCLACTLVVRAGMPHAIDLMDSLRECDVPMGTTRSQFMDGFLKGVLLGVPGLVVP